MKDIILAHFPTIFDLIESGEKTSEAVNCGLCGKHNAHRHDPDCRYFLTGSGDCHCENEHLIINLGGIRIINECCGSKLMAIIASLFPHISSKIPPLLKERSRAINSTLYDLEDGNQWCVVTGSGWPSLKKILMNYPKGNKRLTLDYHTNDHEIIPEGGDKKYFFFNNFDEALVFYEKERKHAECYDADDQLPF
jgi:hypothetical protein